MLVYTLMCSAFNVEIISKMRKLFEFLKSYKNYFDFRNAKTFSEYKNEDHVINLVLDAKSLYKSLYTFFEIELNILKNYSLKNLILDRI